MYAGMIADTTIFKQKLEAYFYKQAFFVPYSLSSIVMHRWTLLCKRGTIKF